MSILKRSLWIWNTHIHLDLVWKTYCRHTDTPGQQRKCPKRHSWFSVWLSKVWKESIISLKLHKMSKGLWLNVNSGHQNPFVKKKKKNTLCAWYDWIKRWWKRTLYLPWFLYCLLLNLCISRWLCQYTFYGWRHCILGKKREVCRRSPDTDLMETCIGTGTAMRMWKKWLTPTLISLFIQAPEVGKETIKKILM